MPDTKHDPIRDNPRPDQGLPQPPGAHPDNSLPGEGSPPDRPQPGLPPRPDQGLPGQGGGRPDNTLPGDLPGGIWGGGNTPQPTPPIVIVLPPGIWGGGNVPMPTPPIVMPQPPGIWGPGSPMPTPPINIPGNPPGIWGGGNVPMPTPPINLPQPPQAPQGQTYTVVGTLTFFPTQ